jgi:hypothetical protein
LTSGQIVCGHPTISRILEAGRAKGHQPGDPHDSFDETPIVIACPTWITLFSRKSVLDDFPLIVS